MGFLMLLKAGFKRQAATVAGVFALMSAASLALTVAATLLSNAQDYASAQMDRLGYGDVTVWVSGAEDVCALAASVADTPGVASAQAQPLVFAGYAANGHHSDDEGQIIAYDAETYPYAFFADDLSTHAPAPSIEPGTVYVSPALAESFDVQVGDALSFELARTGEPCTLTVAGFFEDPFMGGSMIDMKSFLVSSEDYADIAARVAQSSSFDALGRAGAMIHVAQDPESGLSALEFDRALGRSGDLSPFVEFSYARGALLEFALLQHTVLAGFLSLFALALAVVALVVLGHAVSSSVELERRDIAALKTLGCTSGMLRAVQTAQYGVGAVAGMAAGTVLGVLASGVAAGLLVTSAGMLAPFEPRLGWCLAAYVVVLAALAAVVTLKTRGIVSISPVEAMDAFAAGTRAARTPLDSRALGASLALRRVVSDKARYAATFAIAALLVFLVSAVGRIDAWVGPNGEGLMNAFSAADHDIGIQPLNPVDMQAVEAAIGTHDEIAGVYSLAMQPVRVDGAAYTANVIDAPACFHILEGRTSEHPGEIVLTRASSSALGKSVGDTVEVAADAGSPQSFEVVGIYQCANEMGANVGLSLEGYARIGDVRGYIWCYHYLLADGSHNEQIAAELQDAFGAAAAIHTNSWSGLAGLVSTMRVLLVALFAIAALLVLVSTALASGTLLLAERADLAVCKSIGFTSRQLRASFALRMALVTALGAVVGLGASALFADGAIARMVGLFGIGAFESRLGLVDSVLPTLGIVVLSAGFAYLFSRRIKRADPVKLFADFDE